MGRLIVDIVKNVLLYAKCFFITKAGSIAAPNLSEFRQVGRSLTFAFWRKDGQYQAYTWICNHLISSMSNYHICGPLSHIAHKHYQMVTNPGTRYPPKCEGRATPN